MAKKEDRLMVKNLPRYQKIGETEASQDVLGGQLDEEPKEESNWFKQASDYIIGLIDNGKIDEAKDLLYGMGKLPRMGDTEMSGVFSKKINESIEKDFKDTDNIRDRSKAAAGYYGYSSDEELSEQGKPTAKEVFRAEVINPIKTAGKMAANVATIPNRAVRDLYNTAVDIYNAKVSEHNAKKQAEKTKSKKK